MTFGGHGRSGDKQGSKCDCPVAGSDIARVTSNVGVFNQHLECFVQAHDIFFSLGEALLPQRRFGDVLNAGVSFTRKSVITHPRRRFVPLHPSICPGRYDC